MIYSLASHIGKVRKNNEDYCYGEVIKVEDYNVGVFALGDGMGGHNKGEVASKLAVEGIIEFLKENLIQHDSVKIDYIDDILKQGYNEINSIIFEKSRSSMEYEGMGTTLVVAINYKESLYIANVGDSRCYLLRNDKLKKITTDHSVVEELIKAKAITEEEAKTHPRRNQITRAIGTDAIVLVDIFKVNLKIGDKILIASDGLTGFVDKDEMKEILMKQEEVDILAQELIDRANEASGKDNITVILVEQD